MALRSQLITKEFPELDRVERLNNEAFPEEERIPLIDFLKLDGRDDYHLPFMTRMIFAGFASVLYNAKVFYVSFFAIVPQMRSHGYGSRLLINWWTLWTIAFYGLGSRALDVNPMTILSNVWRVGISTSVMVLKLLMPSWNTKV